MKKKRGLFVILAGVVLLCVSTLNGIVERYEDIL